MKITINQYEFIEQFRIMGRMENFSYDGLKALFEYFENLEDDIGEEIECDVIAICCDFTEESIDDVIDNYEIDIIEDDDPIDYDEVLDQVVEYLEENTSVVHVDRENHKVLYQVFWIRQTKRNRLQLRPVFLCL